MKFLLVAIAVVASAVLLGAFLFGAPMHTLPPVLVIPPPHCEANKPISSSLPTFVASSHPSRWKNPDPLTIDFPAKFDNSMIVACGDVKVKVSPLNGRPSSREESLDGTILYRGAFDDCDVSYIQHSLKTEEFLHVLRAPQGDTATWRWTLDAGGLTPRINKQHFIELCEGSVPKLRIHPPVGHDASGKLLSSGKELVYELKGSQLTLTADLRDCSFPVIIDPTWSNPASLIWHTSDEDPIFKLPDGSILLAHGYSGDCEIFNPVTRIWSATGALNFRHNLANGTQLQDGRPMVVGGVDASAITTCETFDPTIQLWTVTGPLNIGRFKAALVLLADGRILASGGMGNGGYLKSCEIFDQSTSTWSLTAPMAEARDRHSMVRLSDNTVLAIGGAGNPDPTACERFDPVSVSWSNAPAVFGTLYDARTVVTPDGRITCISSNPSIQVCDPATLTWTAIPGSTPALAVPALLSGYSRVLFSGGVVSSYSSAICQLVIPSTQTVVQTRPLSLGRIHQNCIELSPFEVMVMGSNSTPAEAGSTYEIYDARPFVFDKSVSVHPGRTIALPVEIDSILSTVTYNLTNGPQNGTLQGSLPAVTYTAGASMTTDTVKFKVNDTVADSNVGTITINYVNQAPTFSAAASPLVAVPGQAIMFTATGSDPDGDAVSYAWDFGDGSTSSDQNPVHAFAGAGVFSATLTVTDQFGAQVTSTVSVKTSHAPVGRFTTSDVVGFVGVPLAFDATYSSDPDNDIASYAWNFGDGSPAGDGLVISRVYTAPGTYQVTLTVVDRDGLTGTVTRSIEVLSADAINSFNGFVSYTLRADSTRQNTDSLTLIASLNVGDEIVSSGSTVAIDIAGVHFEGTLDEKLRDTTDRNRTWQVKANLRKQAAGTVLIQFKLKKAGLFAAFTAAGVIGTDDDTLSLNIPVRVAINGQAIEVLVPSEFEFARNGTKVLGSGDGP